MSVKDGDVTNEGKQLIDSWMRGRQRVERAEDELVRARSDLGCAEERLAAWLTPSGAQPGEKIGVWFEDALIQVEVGGVKPPHDCTDGVRPAPSKSRVTIRQRGKRIG